MVVLENGHYYHVRIILHPQESHWSLEFVDSMLPATTALLDSPNPLLNDQPPDPLTAIVSGTAGIWHPGHALYLPPAVGAAPLATHQGVLSDMEVLPRLPEWLEAIPRRKRTTETPTAPNLCPVFAIH